MTDHEFQQRERLLEAAVAAQKIAPRRVPDYRAMYDADPAMVTFLLTAKDGIKPGSAQAMDATLPEYPPGWVQAPGSGSINGDHS
jgi:hypothetical protein